jgi:hypothetical protein
MSKKTNEGDGGSKEGVELVKLRAPLGIACTTVALGHDGEGKVTQSIDVRPGNGGFVAVSPDIVPQLLEAGYFAVRE